MHPSNFREQHGDEMLCIFDESPPVEIRRLLADASLSFARQWVFHSACWKYAAGAAISCLLVLACGYSTSQAFRWNSLWRAPRHADLLGLYPAPDPGFNEFEFEREAQQAVEMLASYIREEGNRRHDRANRPVGVPNVNLPPTSESDTRD